MLSDNRNDILENSKMNPKLPDSYFDNMEDRVLKNYHRRQMKRHITQFSAVFCVIAVLFVSLHYFTSYNKDAFLLSEDIKSMQDTFNHADNLFAEPSYKDDIAFTQVETEIEFGNTAKKETAVASHHDNAENTFTQEELDYLENYLNEDNYELVYNTLMR